MPLDLETIAGKGRNDSAFQEFFCANENYMKTEGFSNNFRYKCRIFYKSK